MKMLNSRKLLIEAHARHCGSRFSTLDLHDNLYEYWRGLDRWGDFGDPIESYLKEIQFED